MADKAPPWAGKAPARKRVRVNAISFAELLAFMLQQGAATYVELAAGSGLHEVTIRRFIKVLRKKKTCYVAGWDFGANGALNTPMFAIGLGKRDVPRPKKTRAQVASDYRARVKARAQLFMTAGKAQDEPEGAAVAGELAAEESLR